MSLNTQNLQPIINFIWTVADDVLINKFLENQYQDVILPMTVLRRLDLALVSTFRSTFNSRLTTCKQPYKNLCQLKLKN